MTRKAHQTEAQTTIEQATGLARMTDTRIGVTDVNGSIQFYLLTIFGTHHYDTLTQAVKALRRTTTICFHVHD